MITEKNIIAEAYDEGVLEEYARLDSSVGFKAEFLLITHLLKEYVKPGSVVYDIGAGPGRYTEFLLNNKCKVGAIDLSGKSIAALRERLDCKYSNELLFAEKACATQVKKIKDKSADAVLLMGPLYHLTCRTERSFALMQANRILKQGGILFAVFLNTNGDYIFNNPKTKYSECVTSVNFCGYDIPQYRCCPLHANDLMTKAGFTNLELKNLDDLKINGNSEMDTNSLFYHLLNSTVLESNKSDFSQFIYVGRKD